MVYLETIDKFNSILGELRPPGIMEHLKFVQYNDTTKLFQYASAGVISDIDYNTKTLDGIVTKGTNGAANYVWKLDADLNPAWRKENSDYVTSYLDKVYREVGGNSGKFEMITGIIHDLPLGKLAWLDEYDFGAGDDFQVIFNKSGVLAGDPKFLFDYITNQIKLIDNSGILAKTANETSFTNIINYIGGGIVELGDNVFVKEAIKIAKYLGTTPKAGMFQYDGSKPQWHDGTIWHDFANSTDTFLDTVSVITTVTNTDDLYKLYFTMSDGSKKFVQFGVNAFNDKFVPTVSGDLGNIQLSNGSDPKDLTSTSNLTYVNDTLYIGGIAQLASVALANFDTANNGTIINDGNNHIYGKVNNIFTQLDNINYTTGNVGTGISLLNAIVTIDEYNKRIDAKTLIKGSNITLTDTAAGIQIDAFPDDLVATIPTYSCNDLGDGIGIYAYTIGDLQFNFNSVKGGNNIDLDLIDGTIIFNATGDSANHYLTDVKWNNGYNFDNNIFDMSNCPDVTDVIPVKFTREGLDDIVVNFGKNAFDSEPVRNLHEFKTLSEAILNTGTTSDDYKLYLEFGDTDDTYGIKKSVQLGVNAFNSISIPKLVSSDAMSWNETTNVLSSTLTYKLDATSDVEAELLMFSMLLDNSLVYDGDTNTLGVSNDSNTYLKTVSRVEGTTHLSYTLNNDVIIPFLDLGELAFLDTIPIATSQTLGGVIIGDNLSISETGILSADPYEFDVSRLVSYDLQTGYSDGDKQQARTNIQSAYINGDLEESFSAKYMYVQQLLDASNSGFGDMYSGDYDAGFHKVGNLRISKNTITSDWGNVKLQKGYSNVTVGVNYIDVVCEAGGTVNWYSNNDGTKTKIASLQLGSEGNYDLHVQGEVIEFSTSL